MVKLLNNKKISILVVFFIVMFSFNMNVEAINNDEKIISEYSVIDDNQEYLKVDNDGMMASFLEKNAVSESDGDGPKSCEEVLGPNVIADLNIIIMIARILIPILLIAFGIMDFSKALFAMDENVMKKAQATFFKRVIVAIAFFLIPSILSILLKVGHTAWDFIPSGLCGII